MDNSFLDTIKHLFINFSNAWGNNQLVAGLVILIIGGILGWLFSKFIPWIGRLIGRLFIWLWAMIQGNGDDHTFEVDYLSWLINQYRYLGLLPARIVSARWGEKRTIVDLEEIYISLSLSAQSGDENWTEAYANNENSWRKSVWFNPRIIKLFRWYYFFISTLLLLIITLVIAQGLIFGQFSLFHFMLFNSFLFAPLFMIITASAIFGFLKERAFRKEKVYQPGDLALAIDRHMKLVIRGNPGSGKTTLLRYLAVTCARARRNMKSQEDSKHLVKTRLLWNTFPFPIMVTLRRHSDVTNWGEKKELIDTFREEMPPELRKRCPPGFFERKLQKGKCLILLDALDELGTAQARTTMAQRIAGFLEIYDRLNNRMVVTTRIVGYEGQLDQYNFNVRTVQDLKAGEIRALIKQRYKAITASEMIGRKPYEVSPILQSMLQRAERLIKKIESTPRLNQLATNPLLLSLIVLVHYVKVELPEERVLLYRDCVENLTEQWQRVKRIEAGIEKEESNELTLPQKIVLLQEVALAMQQQREDESRQALLPKQIVQEIIAKKLPDIIGGELPQAENERKELCLTKAEGWIRGIQVESGILVEQGLDESGEPLVGFSHLTFQEYLASVALNEDDKYQSLIWKNLLKPAWREVVLLYVSLINDATSVISKLLDVTTSHEGVLLAGYCLAERVKRIQPDIYNDTLMKLKEGFLQASDDLVGDFGKVLGAIGGSEVTSFMRQQIHNLMLKKRLAAVIALGQTKISDPEIEEVRNDLVSLLETLTDIEVTVAARESLAQVNDPRFTSKEPILIRIPKQSSRILSSPKSWKELVTSPQWTNERKINGHILLIGRLFDYLLFTRYTFWLYHSRNKEFEISKYPITNIEYSRFVQATEHNTPEYWIEGTFPSDQATHPVVGVNKQDAEAYCKWLSHETGGTYRLPTEWEWEWAATGTQGWSYPWGEQFDKNKCNTKETGIEGTTPVGSYLAGASQFGVNDMSGNIWEMTKGYLLFGGNVSAASATSTTSRFNNLLSTTFSIYNIFIPPLSTIYILIVLLRSYTDINLKYANLLVAIIAPILLLIFDVFVLFVKDEVLRGGAWNSTSEQAMCFSRGSSLDSKFIGFRCLKEI